MKSFFALAIFSAFAAPAMAESFTRDGDTYDYTVSSMGEATIIDGSVRATGEEFHLKVSGMRVSGRFGASPVSYRIKQEEAKARVASPIMAVK